MTVGRRLRSWRRYREVNKWVQGNAYPATVRRAYWSPSEYESDAGQLKLHGYVATVEEIANPTIDVASAPNVYSKDPRGPLPVTVAMFRITYERRDGAWIAPTLEPTQPRRRVGPR